MIKTFRTFNLAIEFYRIARRIDIRIEFSEHLPCHLKGQLERAASSIVLNLSEGRGRQGIRDQLRFFHIAMGSVRECQAILILAALEKSDCWSVLDSVAAHLYLLIKRAR